jgi:hypothetical protein
LPTWRTNSATELCDPNFVERRNGKIPEASLLGADDALDGAGAIRAE